MTGFDYYLLESDRQIQNPFHLSGYHNKKENMVLQTEITDRTLLAEYMEIPEYASFYHVFSDSIKKVISGYISGANFYGIFLTAKDAGSQHIYWRLDTDNLKKYPLEGDQGINNYEFQYSEFHDQLLLCIVQEKREYLGFREDLAEAVMRRSPIGIRFMELAVTGGV